MIFGNVALFGQERANIQVCETLQKAGHELLLAVNDRGFHWHIQPEVEHRDLQYMKMRFPWNFRKTFSPSDLWRQLRDLVQCNREFLRIYRNFNPDVLHVANETYIIALLPVLLFLKTPIIYRLGDKPNIHFKLYNFLWKYLISRRITRFVCISYFIKEELIRINNRWKDAEVIHNVPSKRAFKTQENIPRLEQKFLTFIYIGQIEKLKGVDILIDAFLDLCQDHPNVRLFLAGDIEHSSLAKEVMVKVDNSPYSEKIKFLGKVNNIDQLFSIGDIGIFPSVVQEALSNVIGEAKMNSKASIIFNSGGMPELVEHKKNGYIASTKDVKGIKEAVLFYLHNPEKIKEHGENAYNSISSLGLDAETYKNKWLKVYNL